MKKSNYPPALEAIWQATPFHERYDWFGERAIAVNRSPGHYVVKLLRELTPQEIETLTPKPKADDDTRTTEILPAASA